MVKTPGHNKIIGKIMKTASMEGVQMFWEICLKWDTTIYIMNLLKIIYRFNFLNKITSYLS